MDSKENTKQTKASNNPPRNPEMEEFFARFNEEMSRAKPGEEPLTTALHALQQLAVESDSEAAVQQVEKTSGVMPGRVCPACGAHNREGHRFCASCGGALGANATQSALTQTPTAPANHSGQHFYHHHYHHHYFSGEGASLSATEARIPASASPPREMSRVRAPLGSPGASLTR